MEDRENQEIERKKRSLKRYRKNRACIERLENKLERLDDRMTTIRSPNLSGMPRGGTPVTIADQMAEKMEIEERIKRLKKKGSKIKAEILAEIDDLDDPRYCEILEAYFIDCLTMEDIAEEMGYNTRHVYRLYSKGVKKLALNGQ